MSDTIQSAGELIAEFNLSNGLHCPNCPDQGWFADGPTDDPEQIQCEFCEMEENSIFNIKRRIKKLIEARDAAIRADEARKQAERYAACVEALKNVSEAEQSVAYQKTGFSEQLAILSMLRQCGEIARKALADMEVTK
jgi:hypothetical protein